MARLFAVTLLLFVLQHPLFMLYNQAIDTTVTLGDYLAVMWHGLPLDITMTCYTLVVPWLVFMLAFALQRAVGQGWVRPVLMVYYAILTPVLALVFVADTVMYGFWHFKLDNTVFLYLDNPSGAFASVSVVYLLLAVLVLVAVAILYFLPLRAMLRKPSFPSRWPWASVLLMLPVAFLIFYGIRGGLGKGTANVSKVYYSDRQYLNHSAVNGAFNLCYSLSHTQQFAEEFRYYDDAECWALTDSLFCTQSVDSDTLFNVARPNVLLLVWEGCGATVAGCVGSPCQATPNLDRYASQGILFSNCQSNTFRTDRGLVSILSGWMGMPTASLMKVPEKSERLPGLARSLRQQGYNTSFWYGGDIGFTNMGSYMLQSGFSRTFSEEDFPSRERTSNWGLEDETLLGHVFEDLKTREVQAEPFFTTVLTLSSHEPWDVPIQQLADPVANSFAYTDRCVGAFLDKLSTLPLWHNTVVIILPDHGVISADTLGMSSPQVIHVPIVMTGGAVRQSRRIETLMNLSDLAATLLGQLGVAHDDFPFSRDVLSRTYIHPSAFHTSKTEFTFFDVTGVTTYDLTADRPLMQQDQTADPEAPQRRLATGKALLQRVYTVVSQL